ncbi:hypothetical protein QBC46DRAFT_347900 [Diplogelasinospora grovesii]|uniref:Uncharacterized protein n=1 Tax=Diplogelasinospora grovesii TaxID=303347 RepID=A0AAN6MWK2_9PEZI|nr:hypothetical protein QBC46DRAFT_347900 [Diplogelasinospora grovesii]
MDERGVYRKRGHGEVKVSRGYGEADDLRSPEEIGDTADPGSPEEIGDIDDPGSPASPRDTFSSD